MNTNPLTKLFLATSLLGDLTDNELVLISLIVALCCLALIGGYIGSFRGRAEFGCFLGLLIGPIGWIIVLLMPDARENRYESNPFIPPPDSSESNPFKVGEVGTRRRRRRQGWY